MNLRKKITGALALSLLTLSLVGCSTADSGQYQLVFGKDPASLLPTVGNAAYTGRSLSGEEVAPGGEGLLLPEGDSADKGNSPAPAGGDTYVDPASGLDCAVD
jgi:ABC-type oligopeptide transport system substrate-binding subunit